MEKACRNKTLCLVDNVIVSLKDLISHFPERLCWVKVTTQSWVVCSDYKSPCPLKCDWIHPMPENSPHYRPEDPRSQSTNRVSLS